MSWWSSFSPYKVGLLVINLVVLLYLLWILKKKRKGGGKQEGEGGSRLTFAFISLTAGGTRWQVPRWGRINGGNTICWGVVNL